MMIYIQPWKIVVNFMNKNPSTYTQISAPVLKILKSKFQNYDGTPFCQVEISHRSKYYQNLNNMTVDSIKKYFNAEQYEVLLLPSGSAMSAVYFNLVQQNTACIFYSQQQFSNSCYQEMKRYHNLTEKTNNWQSIKNLLHNQPNAPAKIVHYNKIDVGKSISSPVFTQQQRKNITLIKNVNYCFPQIENLAITEDVVYFETQKGFGIPGFTVMLIKKELMNKLEMKANSPDMFDFLLMSKMKSVVNTPFTLCTFVLHENINYALQNKEKIILSIYEGKMNYKRLLQRIGCRQAQFDTQNSDQYCEAFNFIRTAYTQREEQAVSMLEPFGWVSRQNKTLSLFIQNENMYPVDLFQKLMQETEMEEQ